MDTMFLKLLTDIAERSPITLWSVGNTDTFSSLFRGQPTSLEQLESSIGALCQVGIAYEKTKRVNDASSTGQATNEIEKALLAQFPENCTSVNSNSPPARLGKLFLPNMLEALVAASTTPQSTATQVDVLSNCMSHLSTCSNQCPSLLAGDETSLTSLMRACMSIAQLANVHNDEDITFLRLSALDVFATITAVPQIKRSITKPTTSPSPRCVGEQQVGQEKSPLLQFLIQGNDNTAATGGGDQKGVLYICAELAVNGVDDDEEGWSTEPALVYDTESTWEDDQVALHAESLLESFVENLGGASTLPSVFQLVEILLATPSWKNQRAVLSMLERCLAAAPVTFVPHVPATVDAALRLIQSSSARVQYQALQLLGSLCCANSVEADGSANVQKQQILVRENYGGAILEAVSHLIKSHCTKVASHACLTVVSYCRGGNGSENCMVPIDKGLIVPYVGNLLDALRSGPLSVDISNPSSITEGSLTILIRAIGAVACVADAVGEEFMPHYSIINGVTACALFGLEKAEGQGIKLTPNMKNTHEVSMLRGSAIEAASIIGQAVSGPNGENVSTYVNDASEIMNIATTLLNSGNTELIPMDQLLAACARIAAVMGSQYVQFMPSVLPHILQRATDKLEVSITDDNDSNTANDEGEDGIDAHTVSIPGLGSKKVKINTTQLEEKAQAARALYEHARALGKEFGPFVEASANAFLPLVNCEYSGDVRSTSAQVRSSCSYKFRSCVFHVLSHHILSQALSQVFKAACLSDASNNVERGQAQALLPPLARALTKQLSKEEGDDELEIENRFAIADATSEIMWDAYEHKTSNGQRVAQITVADAREVVLRIMALIQDCLSRRSNLISEMVNYSFDNDEIARCEDKARSESEYLTHLVDSVGYQLKSLGPNFAPIFKESVAGPLGRVLTTSTHDARAKFAAVCLFDDCVEHCGPTAANTYAPVLLEGIKAALDDNMNEDVELKQVAVYGISQIARHAPKSLPPSVGQDLLMKVYNIAKEVETVPKEDIEHIVLVENAVSSMASLALLRGSPLFDCVSNKSALLKTFMCGLPLEQDYDEAKICHDGLCDLVESNMINVQAEYSTLIRIIGKILALVSEDEVVASQSTCSRLMGVIHKIQQSVDNNSIQVAFAMMEPDSQQALVAAMQ